MRLYRMIVLGLLVMSAVQVAVAQVPIVPYRWILKPGSTSGAYATESPNGRFLLLVASAADSLVMHDKQTQQRWSLGTRGYFAVFSKAGDRIAFELAESGKGLHVWTLPIDPATGRARGAPQRVSLHEGSRQPSFSPDGKSIV